MKNEDLLIGVFGLLFIFSLILFANQSAELTGYATSATTTSNVTISSYFAIAMSANLSDGIQFGNISTLPAINANASHNYDGDAGLNTSMWMNVSIDSNVNVDFCVMADALNTSSGDYIGLGNESYFNSTINNATHPSSASEVSITTSYVKAGPNILVGNNNYYRFWLDVPIATPAGTYNNTVFFKGVSSGGNC